MHDMLQLTTGCLFIHPHYYKINITTQPVFALCFVQNIYSGSDLSVTRMPTRFSAGTWTPYLNRGSLNRECAFGLSDRGRGGSRLPACILRSSSSVK